MPERFFVGSSFACAADTVWRRAARAELSTRTGEVSAMLLWDRTKFYENFSHERLIEEARKFQFPTAITQLCVTAY
eukprot:3338518-Pyramimonas_sp.AAC.1